MFKNKPPLADGQSIDTLIGPQVTLHGDLVFSGGLYVEGRVHGRIVAEHRRGTAPFDAVLATLRQH